MSASEEEKMKILSSEYFPYIHRVGITGLAVAVFLNFLPVIVIYLVYGVIVSWDAAVKACTPVMILLLPAYLMECWMYYPTLGTGGNYEQWAGNTSNCRLPSTSIALDVLKVKPGTPEAEIVGNIAVGVSVWVNMTLVFIGCLLGTLIGLLPPFVQTAFIWVLPAIFGAIYGQFLLKSPLYALINLGLALVIYAAFPVWAAENTYIVLLIIMAIVVPIMIAIYKRTGKTFVKE
jgi:hypothetical protein